MMEHFVMCCVLQGVSSNGEVGAIVDDESGGFDGEPFPAGSVTENWSDQQTMKVKVSCALDRVAAPFVVQKYDANLKSIL
jgi:hypothetical protein